MIYLALQIVNRCLTRTPATRLVTNLIVMYDAMMVRYSSGMQGETLNKLISEQGSKLKKLRVAHGHTPVEVMAGAVIGMVVASVVFFATK